MNFKTVSITIVSLLVFWTGCDNFLEPQPKSFTSTSNFYQSPEDFENALNGAYNRLRTQAGISNFHYLYFSEIRMDNINRHFNVNLPDIQGQPISEWFVVPSNNYVEAQWDQIYNTIAQTNIILNRIDDVDFEGEEGLQEQIKGEAKFIRALSYWYAVQYWGPVPIVLEEVSNPDDSVPEDGRAPESEVYAQIISDLQDAISALDPVAPDPGRATEGAAKFLLGRTYLLTEEYPDAIAVLEEVESDYGYELLDDYDDIWDPSNTNNEESIFELQFGADISGQPHADMVRKVMPWNSRGETELGYAPQEVVATGWYHPSLEFVRMFEDNDARYEANILWLPNPDDEYYPEVMYDPEDPENTDVDEIAIINKFYWPDHIISNGEQEGNDILFRYADVLLSLAEAYWRDGSNEAEAENLLNRIRDRADLPPVDLSDVPMNPLLEGTYLENDNLGRAIFNERSIELFAEGHRSFDLVRFGVAFDVLTAYTESRKEREPRIQGSYNIDEYEILLPIPPSEITNSDGIIEQNPGWD